MFFELSPDQQEAASLGKEAQAEGQQVQRSCSRDMHAMCQAWKEGSVSRVVSTEGQEMVVERSQE